MRRIIILLYVAILSCIIVGCDKPRSSEESVSSEILAETYTLDENVNYEINQYTFPYVCILPNGNYIEIPGIQWSLWMLEETDSTSISVEHLPCETEALNELLINCVAHVVQVPKELIPLYAVMVQCMSGESYLGEDESSYYYGGVHPYLRLTVPTETYVANTELVREHIPDNTPDIKTIKEYMNEIYSNVVRHNSYQDTAVPYDIPSLYYSAEYYADLTDFSCTILDEEWVQCVQEAKYELVNYPEKYIYSEDVVSALCDSHNLGEYIEFIDTKESEVIEIRAQIYATLCVSDPERTRTLNDVIVLYGEYEGLEDPLVFTWDMVQEEWYTNYGKNYYVDIVPSIEYYQQLANLESDKLNITEYTDLNACGLRSIESDYISIGRVWG